MDSLAELLERSDRVVFFGGAGVSTESGIPDFRSATGLYARDVAGESPEYLLSHSCLEFEPERFFDFHRAALLHPDALPNRAHRALARLEAAGRLAAVITQNIDGLHQAAGSRTVLEVHGSVARNHCVDCGVEQDMAFVAASTGVPACPSCGGMVRPDVVLYEESLDQDVMQQAMEQVHDADLLIVGGTSLNVWPAAGLVRFRTAPMVLVNLQPTPFDDEADLVLHQSLGRALGEAVDRLLGPETVAG